MDESKFWDLIQRANDKSGGIMDRKCKAIQAAVALLSRKEATDFKHHCNDPAEPAQLTPLKQKPPRAFSCRAPDAGVGGYRNRSSR